MKKTLYILILLIVPAALLAQQDAMFTHYMFNTSSYNPAYAGTRNALSITGVHRSQWVGFEGAPITQSIIIHTPFRSDFGGGFSIQNDQIGPVNLTSLTVDFSYRMKVSEKAHLAFGLKGGVNLLQARLTGLDLIDAADASFGSNIQSKALPNLGFGAYYYTEKFYAGVSTPKILENDYGTNTTIGGKTAEEKRHYFFIAGGLVDLTNKLQLRPSTFIKTTAGAPIEVDLSAFVVWNDFVWAGPTFRSGDAFGVLAGINITKQLQAGYAYDWSWNLANYNPGSHEIMVRYDFQYKSKTKIRSPRYF